MNNGETVTRETQKRSNNLKKGGPFVDCRLELTTQKVTKTKIENGDNLGVTKFQAHAG